MSFVKPRLTGSFIKNDEYIKQKSNEWHKFRPYREREKIHIIQLNDPVCSLCTIIDMRGCHVHN